MTRRPGVSVLIPFLDTREYLPLAVESVLRQTRDDWEILLIDGGSCDGGDLWAAQMQRRHPGRIRALLPRRGARPGVFESRVLGARSARAPLVALLDSDDEWHPRLLERHVAAYRKSFGRERGLVYCPAVFWWEDGRVNIKAAPASGLYEPGGLLAEFLERDYAKTPCTTGCVLDRRIILESAALARLAGRHMIEDQYLWSHIALRHPIFVSREPLFWYRQRPDSICARGSAKGEMPAHRRRHLRWLMGQVLARSRG